MTKADEILLDAVNAGATYEVHGNRFGIHCRYCNTQNVLNALVQDWKLIKEEYPKMDLYLSHKKKVDPNRYFARCGNVERPSAHKRATVTQIHS